LSPYAPHISAELWEKIRKTDILDAKYPIFNPAFVRVSVFEYPIMINGKLRAKIEFGLDIPQADIEKAVLASENVQKWLEGKAPKKIIIVPKKVVNLVI